jgi:hypothetical protein
MNNHKNKNNKKKNIQVSKGRPGGSFASRHTHNPSNVLINRNGLNPFPTRYRTLQTAILSGAIPIGSTDLVLRCRAGPYQPFNGGLWPGVLTASTSTLDVVGFSNLCSITGPYTRWVCYGMKVKITMIPTANVDTIGVAVGFQDVNVAVPSGYADASAEPFYNSTICQVGATIQHLTNQATLAEIAGYANDASIKANDNLMGAYASNPASTYGCYVAWGCLNGLTNSAIIPYEFEVILDVEYFQEAGGALLDATRRPTVPSSVGIPRVERPLGLHYHTVDGVSVSFEHSCQICDSRTK